MSASTEKLLQQIAFKDELQQEDEQIDLRDLIKVVLKYKWPIVAFTGLAMLLTVLMVSSIAPTYRATTTLLIDSQQVLPMDLDEINGIDKNDVAYHQTQFQILRSRKLAHQVMLEMNLYTHPEFNSEVDSAKSDASLSDELTLQKQLAVNQFLKMMRVTPIKQTRMVRISFDAKDPTFAAQVANKIADTYIITYLQSRRQASTETAVWLDQRRDELKLQLEMSQDRLLSYKEANELIDIEGNENRLNEQEIAIVTGKLIDAEGQLARSKILYDEVAKTKARGTKALMGLSVVDSNEMVRRYKVEAQQVQIKLNELRNRYGEKHPKVVDAISALNISRSNINSQINNIVDTVERDYLFAQQNVDAVRATLNEGKILIQKQDRSNVQLTHLQREVELNQQMYDSIYTRSREMTEAVNLATANAEVAEYAEPPIYPVSPKKKLILLLATILSAIAAITFVLIRESLSDTIAKTADVETSLGVKMLGILPMVPGQSRNKNKNTALVPDSLNENTQAFQECIRTIRTSICLDDLETKNKVIMITSALPSEGKSTLASHLAYSLSSIEKVLLIECDLRRPSLHRAFNFSDTLGLSQLLSGEARFSECIKLNALNNLDIIPAGMTSESPLDLLYSKQFSQLLQHMRKHYDRIIIDSAPVQAVSDALLIGQLADTALYTVKANATNISVAARGIERLKEAGVSVAGAVVSQVKLGGFVSSGDLDYQGYYEYFGDQKQPNTNSGPRETKDEPKQLVA